MHGLADTIEIHSQDAFTETYLTTQRSHVFTSVGVLIYVFDVESRSFDGQGRVDLTTYTQVIRALAEFSPQAHVFALVHKMDLVQNTLRDKVVEDRGRVIREASGDFGKMVRVYGTSIWDQSLYGAWGMCAFYPGSYVSSLLRALLPSKTFRSESIHSSHSVLSTIPLDNVKLLTQQYGRQHRTLPDTQPRDHAKLPRRPSL